MGLSNDADFHQKTAIFVNWFKQLKGAYLSSKIEVTDLRDRNAGRGIVATEDIEENESLFSIAHSDLLTVSTSVLQQHIPHILDGLDAWMSLILTMIYEAGQGAESKWWPYLNILPTEFDTLMYWSPGELAELQGSLVLQKVGKDDANLAFLRNLLPIVKEHACLFGEYGSAFSGPDAESVLLDVAHRMGSLIMAYAFDLQSEAADEGYEDDFSALPDLPKAMIPVADIFNADGEMSNAHLLQGGMTMTMLASKQIRKGQEILNDYGQRPRSDLLRRYGYITDNARKWDVVELKLETLVQAACEHNNLNEGEKERRLELIDEWQVYEDGYDLHRPQANESFEFDPALRLVIHAFLLNQEAFEEEMKIREAPDEVSLDLGTALVLRKVLIQRRASYGSSIAEDVALLQSESVKGRTRMAVEVRLGEKEILAAALDSVETFIGTHSSEFSMPVSNEEPATGASATKRRKT